MVPPEHPMYGYTQHMMGVLDYVLVLLWVVIIMKVFMIAVLAYASWSFVKWRKAAEKQAQTDEKMTQSVQRAITGSQESVHTVREMVVTVQEFLSMARGWAASAEAHEQMAKNTNQIAKKELSRSTEEVKQEVRAVPEATAAKVAQMIKVESGILDITKTPPVPPETDEIEIEPGKAPLG